MSNLSTITLQEEPTDERDFINWVERMVTSEGNILGHHEDAIAINQNDDIFVINIDGWVASTDRPNGMTPHQVGYRAVANAISDVITKGAKPEGMIISSSIAPEYKSEIKEIIKGFRQASQDFDTPFFGGDMNSSNDLVIDVTVWGRTQQIVRRDGAKIGDLVYWLGPNLGCTAAALGILTKEWKGDYNHALDIMGYPNLFPEFLDIEANAAVDCSDGLAKSLYLITKPSNVRIDIPKLPTTAKWIIQVAEENNISLQDLYLYGGEELGIVFTCDPDTSVPDNAQLLGEVSHGEGVFIENKLVQNKGWTHFVNKL